MTTRNRTGIVTCAAQNDLLAWTMSAQSVVDGSVRHDVPGLTVGGCGDTAARVILVGVAIRGLVGLAIRSRSRNWWVWRYALPAFVGGYGDTVIVHLSLAAAEVVHDRPATTGAQRQRPLSLRRATTRDCRLRDYGSRVTHNLRWFVSNSSTHQQRFDCLLQMRFADLAHTGFGWYGH